MQIDIDDVVAYLTTKGVRTFRAAGNEVTAHCFIGCDDGDPKGKGKLYFNTDSWLHDCKRCGNGGNRKTLLRHFGDEEKKEYTPGLNPAMRRRVLAEYTDVCADTLIDRPDMLAVLTSRGLSTDTILEFRLGYAPQGRSMLQSLPHQHNGLDLRASGMMTTHGQDFHAGRITIPYLSHRDVVQVRGKDPKGKYFTPAGDTVRLYNADALREATVCIIVEGEFDCLILQQVLRNSGDPRLMAIAVVGVAGAGAFPEGMESYFEDIKRVYIGFDPDGAGEKGAAKLKALLGSKTRVIKLTDELPKCDWTEYLRDKTDEHPHGGHDWTDVRELLDVADSEGRRLWTAQDAHRQWAHIETNVGGIKTGFQELDSWLAPGIKPGQVLIPYAKTGVGKTNFLCNIAYYARARPTLFISLEMTRAEVYERLRRIYRFWWPFASEAEIHESWSLLRIVDLNRLPEGAIAVLCEEFAEEVGVPAELVFVDYLGYYARGMPGNSAYDKTTNAVMSLKADAKTAQVGIVSPHQVNRSADDGRPLSLDDARDSGAVEETADHVCSLYRPSDAVSMGAGGPGMNDGDVRLQILKNRNGRKGMATTINFSMASLVLVDKSNHNASAMVDHENFMIGRGESYETIRKARGTQQTKLKVAGDV